MALTRITKGVIKPNENYDTHNIVSTGIVTAVGLDINGNADISGNFSVGGILTYEDVTSIDSVGVITARQGIKVGTGITIGPAGVGTFTSVHAIDSFACQKYPTTKISFPTNQDHLQIFTSNTQRMRFYGAGTIFIGAEAQSPSGNAALYLNRSSTSVFSDSSRLYDQPNHAMVHIKNHNATGGGEAGVVFHNDNGAAGVVAIYGKKRSNYISDCIFRFRDSGSTSVESFRVRTTDIKVGTGVTIETNGQATFSGIVTATQFKGDGSQLSGIDASSLKFGDATKVQATNTGAVVTGILTATGRVGVGTNTTTERNALTGLKAGHLIMNSTTNLLEYYNGTSWTPIDTPPTVTSVNNSNILESQIAAGFDLVITGSNFKSGATVTFIGNDGTEHISPTTTVNTTTQITSRVHGSVSNANEPYDVKIANASGLSGILEDAFNINAKPTWTTASGIITTIGCNATGIHTTIAATDPEGDAITYSGTVGGGLALSSSGVISGDPTDVSSDTTLSFTANATSSGSNVTPRSFSVVVTPEPVLSNLEVWFDPRNFSSLANNSTASSNSASNTNATWTLTNDGASGYVSGTNNQAIETTSGSRTAFHTKNQDVTAFDNCTNFTFESWIYVGGNLPSWGFIIGKSDFWGSNQAGIYIHSNGSTWGFHTEGTYGIEQNLPSNGWYHLVAVRNLNDANCRKLYVNNSVAVQDNTGDNDANHILNNDCALTFGGDCPGNTSNFNVPAYTLPNTWKFGHARFYTAALSASQVTQNWNAEKAIYGL